MTTEKFNIFPTRTNYKLIDSRLLGAKRGHSLLKSKSDVLQIRYKKLEELFKDKTNAIDDLFKKAFIMLSRAEFYEANTALFLKSCERTSISVETSIEQVCGVVLPTFKIVKHHNSGYEYISTSAEKLMAAKKAFEELVEVLVEICTLKNSFLLLKESLDSTNRRMKALEYILIPKLENTYFFIASDLDEQERDEFYRLKKIQSLNK